MADTLRERALRTEYDEFIRHLKSEAEYGLEHSHGGPWNRNCNAQRQLRLIIAAINQFNGITDGHPIGFAIRKLAE